MRVPPELEAYLRRQLTTKRSPTRLDQEDDPLRGPETAEAFRRWKKDAGRDMRSFQRQQRR